MNLNKINMYASITNVISFFAVVIGLITSDMNISVISLMIFCVSGTIGTATYLQNKFARLSIVNELLENGVFDEVLEIPDEYVEKLKL